MADGRQQREQEIFARSLELPAEERTDYLRAACGDDHALEERIHRLLGAHARANEETSRAAHPPTSIDDDRRQIGPYTLGERIGEGGMGVVHVAEQKEPVRRRVALKLIKAGMDTKEVIARFHSERQALALMTHPNIARILDAGATEEGRPFFVMEYVPGLPLLEYCDRHRLETHERVRLFVDICMAVQHAHQKGVIHRDIKPSNIVVTEEDGRPVPKVIDFGVAKAVNRNLSDVTLQTRIGRFVGTPEYVSPEQAQPTALDVDTRADVYSLGAVLYELLSGERPFDLRELDYPEILKTIGERDPSPPSARVAAAEVHARHRNTDPESLVRKLRGDLDWITMKAMEKDRRRRYSSASELAADLTRHLTQEPVLAGPPSTTYRLGKLVRRHALLLLVGGIGLLALIAAVVGTSFGLLKARQEAQRARVQAAIAEEINTFLNEDLLAAVAPTRLGIAVSVRQVLDRASERVDGMFEGRPLVEASLRETIGSTYQRLGEYAAAEPHLTRAVALRRDAQGPTHPDTLRVQSDLGELHRLQGRHADSESRLLESLAVQRESLGDDHPDTLASINSLAILYQVMGKHAEAEQLYLECLEARRRIIGPDDPQTLSVAEGLSILYQHMGRLEEAEDLQLEAWNGHRRSLGEEHADTLNSVINLTALYLRQGRYDEAEPLMETNLEALRRVMGTEHPRTLMTMNNLGYLYERVGRFDEAEELLLEALSIKRRVVGDEHPSTLQSITNLIRIYGKTGNEEAVETYSVELLETRKRKAGRPDAAPVDRYKYARLLLDAVPQRLRDPVTALRYAQQANEATAFTDPSYLRTLAEAHHATGNDDRAIEIAERALSLTPPEQTVSCQRIEEEIEKYRTSLER